MHSSVLITGKVPREWTAELNGLARVTIWEGEEYLMPRTRCKKLKYTWRQEDGKNKSYK